MSTRREQLFNAKAAPPPGNVIKATVQFRHNRQAGIIEPLKANEKMICALRKCLAAMSSKNKGAQRYFIADNQVTVLQQPTSTLGRPGDRQSYRATGRCRLGVCHADGHSTSMPVEFSISFRDTEDDRGMADVEYFEPTTIDVIASPAAA